VQSFQDWLSCNCKNGFQGFKLVMSFYFIYLLESTIFLLFLLEFYLLVLRFPLNGIEKSILCIVINNNSY